MFLVAFDLFVVCPAVVVGVAEKYDKIGASFCFCAQLPVPLNCYVLLQHLAKKTEVLRIFRDGSETPVCQCEHTR